MKRITLFTIIFLSTRIAFAQTADQIKGTWFNAEKDGKIEIYDSAGKYYGKLIWIKLPFEADGKTARKDRKNKDFRLKDRSLLNIFILSHFSFNNNKWTDGGRCDQCLE